MKQIIIQGIPVTSCLAFCNKIGENSRLGFTVSGFMLIVCFGIREEHKHQGWENAAL